MFEKKDIEVIERVQRFSKMFLSTKQGSHSERLKIIESSAHGRKESDIIRIVRLFKDIGKIKWHDYSWIFERPNEKRHS